MNATWFDFDGQEVDSGQYTPITKSVYRAAVDAAAMFGGVITMVNGTASYAVVAVGNKRLVVGKS